MAEEKPLYRIIMHGSASDGSPVYDQADDLRAQSIVSGVSGTIPQHDATIGAPQSTIHTNYPTLTGNNTYSGTTFVTGTGLQVGNNGTTGSLGSGDASVATNVTSLTANVTISGSATLSARDVTVTNPDAEAVYYLKQGSTISYTSDAGVFALNIPLISCLSNMTTF